VIESGWLTPVRIRRALAALAVLPLAPDAWTVGAAHSLVWAKVGGLQRDLVRLLKLLTEVELVSTGDGRISRLKAASPILVGTAGDQIRRFGSLLIHLGYFDDQARMVFENGHLSGDGALICAPKIAHDGAPQLLGLLSYWESVEMLPQIKIPRILLETLGLGSALPTIDDAPPIWAREQKAVGNRAEVYSVRWLRSTSSDPTQIAWVAKDTDALGYDIEDRRTTPHRAVEVKGSRSKEVVFVLSELEFRKCNAMGAMYSLHYWGGIDLDRAVDHEYTLLLAAGYPFVIDDLAKALASHEWSMAPASWEVRQLPAG